MTTDAQIKANRQNSQSSTGPTSPEGRRRVSMNAIRHSFAGQTCLIPDHEREAYDYHFASFRAEYKPAGPTEEFLVQSLAEISWSTQQIRAQITNLITMAGNRGTDTPHAGMTPEIEAAIGQAKHFDSYAHKINLLGVYESRKMRLFYKTRQELLEIQQLRKAEEKAALEEAARLRQADKATRQPNEPEWQPEENGFVCSIAEIDRYILQKQRLDRLKGGQSKAA